MSRRNGGACSDVRLALLCWVSEIGTRLRALFNSGFGTRTRAILRADAPHQERWVAWSVTSTGIYDLLLLDKYLL